MQSRTIGLAGVLAAAVASLSIAPALADGGKAKNEVLEGTAEMSQGGRVAFRVDTSPIIFYAGTVNAKYHVLLIRVVNRSSVALALSREQDSIELEFADGSKLKGLINLAGTDPATWDGLEAEIRTAVAYPAAVPAGEEEGVYLYVPVGALTAPRKRHEMPAIIRYRIKSLAQPVELHHPSLAKADSAEPRSRRAARAQLFKPSVGGRETGT